MGVGWKNPRMAVQYEMMILPLIQIASYVYTCRSEFCVKVRIEEKWLVRIGSSKVWDFQGMVKWLEDLRCSSGLLGWSNEVAEKLYQGVK